MITYTKWTLQRVAGLALPAILAVTMTGCDLDKFLDVDDDAVALPGAVSDPSALPVIYAGAVRDFTRAYSGTGSIGGGGDNDSQILITGLFTDELLHTGTFPTRREIDKRDIPTTAPNSTSDNGTLSDAYRNLHRARRAAEQAEELYEAAEAGDSGERSVISSLAGYSYILFGENYCEGVPYSDISFDGSVVTYGDPSTRAETFQRAIDAFDKALAIAVAADDTAAEYLARIGKARALLNQGQATQAAAVVAGIPGDFSYELEHSLNSTGENNGVFVYSINSGRYGLIDGEGGNGLDWTVDERTATIDEPRAPFNAELSVPFITQNKYPDRKASVVLADGKEALLIQAEAALGSGNFINFINDARAVDGLPALTDPGSRDDQVKLLFEERGYALWLTSHRLGDLRRMIRDHGFTANQVFPTGAYVNGGTYGNDVNLPIHVDENNNPKFTGCINRDA